MRSSRSAGPPSPLTFVTCSQPTYSCFLSRRRRLAPLPSILQDEFKRRWGGAVLRHKTTFPRFSHRWRDSDLIPQSRLDWTGPERFWREQKKIHNVTNSVVDPKLFFFPGSWFGFNLNFVSGFGSGLSMKNTFELQICRLSKHHKKWFFKTCTFLEPDCWWKKHMNCR